MNTAEYDRATVRAGRRQLAQLITVAGQIRELNDFVLLIVVAQNEQLRPKFFLDRPDTIGQLFVLQRFIGRQLKDRFGRDDGTHGGSLSKVKDYTASGDQGIIRNP
jgi:hypothetical protein